MVIQLAWGLLNLDSHGQPYARCRMGDKTKGANMSTTREDREDLARQGLSIILPSGECPQCGYAARSTHEEMHLMTSDLPCPNCNATGITMIVERTNYLDVFDWIAHCAIGSSRKDYVTGVIMFCALVESILEALKSKHLSIDPHRKNLLDEKFKNDPRGPAFKDVFGMSLSNIVADGPPQIRRFPDRWNVLRDKRNNFLHGKSSTYDIHEEDAHEAMDLALPLTQVYAWINNKYCLSKNVREPKRDV